MSNLSIRNGNVSGSGGAINMSDAVSTAGTTLTLTNVFFSNNHADYGGAIYEPRGTLTIVHSNFSGNTAGAMARSLKNAAAAR
jgi:predicted outer membrane repeat protein